MPRKATVYSIVIASPSDVSEERELVARVINEWNYAHSQTRGITLEPIRWETHTYPELGERPQAVINSQIIDRSDILIGIFGNQLGTDTGVAPSGTVEEIRRFEDAKKPVALYFSERPVSVKTIRPEQLQRLEEFRRAVYKEGLVRTFSDLTALEREFTGDLARIINNLVPRVLHKRGNQTPKTLLSGAYDRQAAFNLALQAAKKPLIRGTRYTRNDIITNHGDVRILETWENVVSYSGDPLSEIPTLFRSHAGRQAAWTCRSQVESQSVDWRLDDGDHPEGHFVFDPPLKSTPISFCTERYIFNGFSFTQLERLQATDGQDKTENFSAVYRNIYDECMFSVKFPEHRFPKNFSINVYNSDGTALDQERALVVNRFKAWPEIQTFSFSISEPLPGIKYSVTWELPEDSSSQLSATESGFVDEVTRRLLGLRNGCCHSDSLCDCLEVARKRLIYLFSPSTKLTFSVSLYVYDRQKSGLVCVATLGDEEIERNWSRFFFKPGRGVAGRAFRRRALEIFPSLASHNEPDVFEKVEGQEQPPKFVICLPLFFAGHTDRVMAILSFETKAASPELAAFLSRPSIADEIGMHFERWYEEILADAIGVSRAREFWQVSGLNSGNNS